MVAGSGRALLLVLFVLAGVLRLVAVPLLRADHPVAADRLARHWHWLPVLALIAAVTLAIGPIGLLFGAFAVVAVLAWPGAFPGAPR
jgi:hypothetical protein